jgi:thymidylate synthase
MSNNIDRQYKELLEHILHFGIDKADRTGTGTKSIFGWQIRHNMKEGFPLLTTKKMAWKTMVTELLWFLRGDTNIKYLVNNDCHIWDGDAYKNYSSYVIQEWEDGYINELEQDNLLVESSKDVYRRLTKEEFINKIKTDDEFAKKWGELGPIYGRQWRSWNSPETVIGDSSHSWQILKPIDQIANLINELKTNPDSRRLIVSAWNVGELDSMVLPPCHYGFQVYTRELTPDERVKYFEKNPESWSDNEMSNVPKRAISLMWNQRSVDTFLGLPFNIASYALLLEIIAKEVNMVPEELIGNLGDVHLYNNHIEQAKEQITRTPFELPKLIINSGNENWHLLEVDEIINTFDVDITFKVENYQSHPAIKAPLSN